MTVHFNGPSRYLCACLEEMRALVKASDGDTRPNIMLSLIEEVQVYANRMEAGLEDKHTIEGMNKKIKKMKKEIRELDAKREKMREDVGEENDEDFV